jgi:hypothetical protein
MGDMFKLVFDVDDDAVVAVAAVEGLKKVLVLVFAMNSE